MPVPDEMDSFAEFSSDKFRNLDEVDEFHDKTAEFPMDIETDSAVLGGAALDAADIAGKEETEGAEVSEGSKETEEEKREKERSNKATKEFIKNATNISSAQALAPVAVALVVTSAVVIPFIENVDVEVNLNMEFVAGILSYSIEIINASENETYEAFVYEGTSVIKETVIENGQLTDSIGGLPPYREHRVEVRSGSPALYVLSTSTIPAAPSWAEWGHLTVGFDVIDYGVYYHGISGEVTLTLTDPYDEEVLYTKTLEEGLNSDIITGLRSSHQYNLTVASDTTLYLYEEVETEYTDVEWDHLTIIDNNIDYGVISDYSIENLTISLYDPVTSSVVYTKELLQGYDSDTIVDLQFGHSYELTVATEDEIYLFETVVTDSEPVTVTVDHITPVNNTIDYEITVSGEGKALNLSLYDAAGGPPAFTTTIKSGSNSRVIEGLQYNHGYLLTVTSSTKSYVSENVTTEKEPTKVTLDQLKATQTTVDYKVTVTGDRDVATAYLKDPTSGAVLYSKELKVGANTAVIDKLKINYTYLFTVSSKTETFISQNITTDPTQTEVVLNHVKVVDDTIDYEVTVTGTSDTVAAHLYDSEGKEIYSVPLSVGSNTGVIGDLEYGSTYNFVVSSETKKYVEAAVTVDPNPTEVFLNELLPDDNTISYNVTVTGTSVVVTAYLYDADGTEVYAAELSEGINEYVIEDLEYDHEYQFRLASESTIYINETVYVEAGTTTVSVEYVEGEGNSIKYSVHVEGRAKSLFLIVSDNDLVEEITRVPLSAGDNIDVIEGLDYETAYNVTIKDDLEEYYSETVYLESQYSVYLEPDGNAVVYEVTIYGIDLSRASIALYDAESQVSVPTPMAIQYPTGTETKGRFAESDMEFLHEYKVSILIDREEVESSTVRTQDRVNIVYAYSMSNVPGVEYKVSVYDTDYSDLFVCIYDVDEEFEPTQCLDRRQITESITVDTFELPSMNFNRFYVVTIENTEGTFAEESASTTNVGSIFMEPEGNTITCEVNIFIDSVDNLTIRLYSDESCEVPVSEPIAVTGKSMTHKFEDLEYNHEYFCGILWKGNVATTFNGTTQFGEISSEGVQNTVECSVTLYSDDLDGVKLGLYKDSNFIEQAVEPVQVTGRMMTYTFTKLDYYTEYFVAVKKNGTVMAQDENSVMTGRFSASIENNAIGNTIYSTITFGITDFTGVTVCIYSDASCEYPIQGHTPESVYSSPKQYNCTELEYETDYYIGVKYNGKTMVSEKATTGKEAEATQFDIDGDGVYMFYDIDIYCDYQSGKITITDVTSATAALEIHTRNIAFETDGKEIESVTDESLEKWAIGHSYKLQIELDGTSYDLKTLVLINPVQNLTYALTSSKVISYEATLGTLTYPVFLYLWPDGGDEAAKKVDLSVQFSGTMNCSDLEDGDYYLYVNKDTPYDPSSGAAWSSNKITLATSVRVEASQSQSVPTTITATVTFDPSAGSGFTIGVYNNAGCTSPVGNLISIDQGTETRQYEFEGLTLGSTYYVGVLQNGDLLASQSVTLQS